MDVEPTTEYSAYAENQMLMRNIHDISIELQNAYIRINRLQEQIHESKQKECKCSHKNS